MRGRGHLMVAQGGGNDGGRWLLGGDRVGQTKQGGRRRAKKGRREGEIGEMEIGGRKVGGTMHGK